MRTVPLPGLDKPVGVGKILCIGQNYARHAAEMNSEPPAEPMVFFKPSTALTFDRGTVVLPTVSNDVHHEVELVVAIGVGGKDIPEDAALSHVAGYAVGLDMTARDLQLRAKGRGHPWALAKGFDTFAPLGPFVEASRAPDPQDLPIALTVNGELRQGGHTSDMIFPVRRLIAWCSRAFTLEPGDLLFTGTPEGVGPVGAGDVLVARIADWPTLTVTVAGR